MSVHRLRSILVAAVLLATRVPAQPGTGLLPVVARLGSTAIKPEEGFSGVVGATFLPNGTIVVGDAGRRSIHRFDANGRYLGSTGRQGKGPGEFTDLLWLLACADGSVLTFDESLNRISVFDGTGAYVKAVAPPSWFSFDALLSCESPTSVVWLQDMPRTKPPQRGTVTRFPAVVAKANLLAEGLDTVTVLSGTDYYFAKARGFADLPLGARAIAASSGDRIAAGNSSDTSVLLYHRSSRRVDTLRVSNARTRTDATDWRKAIQKRLEREYNPRSREMVKSVLQEAERPTYLPIFDALLVDRYSAAVWARLFSRNERSEWARLNPVSGRRSKFLLPTNVQVMDITKTRLLGLQRNEDGTEELLIYSFER